MRGRLRPPLRYNGGVTVQGTCLLKTTMVHRIFVWDKLCTRRCGSLWRRKAKLLSHATELVLDDRLMPSFRYVETTRSHLAHSLTHTRPSAQILPQVITAVSSDGGRGPLKASCTSNPVSPGRAPISSAPITSHLPGTGTTNIGQEPPRSRSTESVLVWYATKPGQRRLGHEGKQNKRQHRTQDFD